MTDEDRRDTLALMTIVHGAGGTLRVPGKVVQEFIEKAAELGNAPVSIGYQLLPDGLLLVNLLGEEEIAAWDAGAERAENEASSKTDTDP
jgi:hypothetical protein